MRGRSKREGTQRTLTAAFSTQAVSRSSEKSPALGAMATFIPTKKAEVDTLKRAEVLEFLKNLGERVDEKCTVVELKAQLKASLFEETADGPQKHLNKLSTKTKAELQAKCAELEVSYTPNMLKGELMRRIRHKVFLMTTPEAGDKVGFGKHAELTYGETKKQHDSYCKWVQEAARTEESPHDLLKRFAGWLNMLEAGMQAEWEQVSADSSRKDGAESFATAREKKGAPSEASVPSSAGKLATATEKSAASSRGSRSATSSKQAELQKSLDALLSRVTELQEEQQSRPPRKKAQDETKPMEVSIATPAQSEPATAEELADIMTKVAEMQSQIQALAKEDDRTSLASSWARASRE